VKRNWWKLDRVFAIEKRLDLGTAVSGAARTNPIRGGTLAFSIPSFQGFEAHSQLHGGFLAREPFGIYECRSHDALQGADAKKPPQGAWAVGAARFGAVAPRLVFSLHHLNRVCKRILSVKGTNFQGIATYYETVITFRLAVRIIAVRDSQVASIARLVSP
jgi:hypothetical protein